VFRYLRSADPSAPLPTELGDMTGKPLVGVKEDTAEDERQPLNLDKKRSSD